MVLLRHWQLGFSDSQPTHQNHRTEGRREEPAPHPPDSPPAGGGIRARNGLPQAESGRRREWNPIRGRREGLRHIGSRYRWVRGDFWLLGPGAGLAGHDARGWIWNRPYRDDDRRSFQRQRNDNDGPRNPRANRSRRGQQLGDQERNGRNGFRESGLSSNSSQ